MKEIFKRIIEIDNSAKELYREAAKEKERLQKEIVFEVKNMESEIKLMANEKIELLVSQNRKDIEEKLNDISKVVQQKLSEMEGKYTRNKDTWEQKIFLNVIGE